MNRICLIGRLTRKPELKESESGIKQATFGIAVQRNYKNEEGEYEVDFINCVAWRKTAELIEKHFDKGSQIGIEGRLQINSVTQADGTNKNYTNVVVENITFIGSKEQAGDKEQDIVKQEVDDPFKDFGDEVELTDADLPF